MNGIVFSTQQIEESLLLIAKSDAKICNGLTNNEVSEIEGVFDFQFPPDLCALLKCGLPESEGFPNWRLALSNQTVQKDINRRLNWPLAGMKFDVENCDVWLPDWGEKPDTKEEREKIVEQFYLDMPKLIPIYAHRYISSEPHEFGNPIFSVYQLDIIYYGVDLYRYFQNEFGMRESSQLVRPDQKPKAIRFWSGIASGEIEPYALTPPK